MYMINGWWFLSSGGSYRLVFMVGGHNSTHVLPICSRLNSSSDSQLLFYRNRKYMVKYHRYYLGAVRCSFCKPTLGLLYFLIRLTKEAFGESIVTPRNPWHKNYIIPL